MAKHAPQPVHRSGVSSGTETPPALRLKRIARASHASPQVRHTMRFSARHRSAIVATNCHGLLVGSRGRAPSRHAAAQRPQKVHSPREKSIWGKPPEPLATIWVGHTPMQSPQRVQSSMNSPSTSAQGGRIGWRRPPKSPRRNRPRDMDVANMPSPRTEALKLVFGGPDFLDLTQRLLQKRWPGRTIAPHGRRAGIRADERGQPVPQPTPWFSSAAAAGQGSAPAGEKRRRRRTASHPLPSPAGSCPARRATGHGRENPGGRRGSLRDGH